MTVLFLFINLLKLLVLLLFLLINWNDEGSPGWAFQHLLFFYLFLFLFLPLSFLEKSILTDKSVVWFLTFIPLFVALSNLIPLYLGNASTKVFILTQILGIGLTAFELVLYFKPGTGRT